MRMKLGMGMAKLLRRVERALLLALALMMGVGFGAEAAFVPNRGERPMEKVNTVEETKTLPDDAHVVLQGYIVDHVRSDHYTFEDDTGSVTVEIDDDEWRGLIVSPADRVEIRGEVDRDLLTMEVEVEYIRKLE
ncbi:MAG: NirD/YgiW/YdeI family stress tolerance protein [Synergistaceae bacterium]|nr:NirD/YgiW/YdeI family stress tolerance protein [Synergistaceae bacterium]